MNNMMDQNGVTHAVPHDRLTCRTMCNFGTVRELALTEECNEIDCRYCLKAIREGAEPDNHDEEDKHPNGLFGPDCRCGHGEIDHVCDNPGSPVDPFRPCFMCGCFGYSPVGSERV